MSKKTKIRKMRAKAHRAERTADLERLVGLPPGSLTRDGLRLVSLPELAQAVSVWTADPALRFDLCMCHERPPDQAVSPFHFAHEFAEPQPVAPPLTITKVDHAKRTITVTGKAK